jgi:hypothetical protein
MRFNLKDDVERHFIERKGDSDHIIEILVRHGTRSAESLLNTY